MKVKSYTAGHLTLRLTLRQRSADFWRAKDWQRLTEIWSQFLKSQSPCRQLRPALKAQRHWEIALELCGDRRIQTLNKTFRRKNKITDVLSFPQFSDLRQLKSNFFPATVVTGLGDVVICVPQARRQAAEHRISLLLEVVHLANHGLLHVLGLDHELSDGEEKLMQQWEQYLIGQWFKKEQKRKK